MDIYKGEVFPGKPYPLGASWDGNGVNFALYSKHASQVLLCLFNSPEDIQEYTRITLSERTDYVWHGYIPGLKPGQLYGYRVDGPFDPLHGHLFNTNKLLVDPYAKTITGATLVTDEMHVLFPSSETKSLPPAINNHDSAAVMNKCMVIDDAYDWEGIRKPEIPFEDTIIYETHLKGFTAAHPGIAEQDRGTYRAMGSDLVIRHFKELGVTAVEFLPLHHFVHNSFLLQRKLTNYWGYNTLGFFAPHAEYATDPMGRQVTEFKDMVKAYHRAGIEVILDVVYNHTGEGDHTGPVLSFKGIDNVAYYRLNEKNKQLYVDYTGTGNTLNMENPRCLQLVMDSLRYWAIEMQVDGFRFDLASTLARDKDKFVHNSAFFQAVLQDPVLSKCKLIAEPWDLGLDGYQVGNFPAPWSEWNGKYRDTIRKFWRGDEWQIKKMTSRLGGSPDLYADKGKNPSASINFITCHDGFTLNDLVSYNKKHNKANGEANRDGDDHNNSFNYGAEGNTSDSAIISLREKQKRNFLATLMFSRGIPMISHGDEYGRTQSGNNNAYCQDSPLAWMTWNWNERQQDLYDFVLKVVALRKQHPVLFRNRYPLMPSGNQPGTNDLRWLNSNGKEITSEEWNNNHMRVVGMLCDETIETSGTPHPIASSLLLIMNSYWDTVEFTLPNRKHNNQWKVLLDTSLPKAESLDPVQEMYPVEARSLVLLKNISEPDKLHI